MATLEELLAPQKTLSLEELLPKRRQFTLEELKETEKGLLTEAQKVVKWREEMDTPSKWTAEFWSSLGESMRESFRVKTGHEIGEILTKEFWSATGKKWLTDAYETVKEETGGRQMRWIERTARIAGQQSMYAPALKAIERGVEPSPIKEAGVEAGRTAVDYVTFIPKMLINFANDPLGTIKEESFGMSTLIAAIAGVKAFKAINGSY